jgi:hypothetical protein
VRACHLHFNRVRGSLAINCNRRSHFLYRIVIAVSELLLKCESLDFFGRPTTPTMLQPLIGSTHQGNDSAFLGCHPWLASPVFLQMRQMVASQQPLWQGAAASSEPSSGEVPLPQLRMTTTILDFWPESKRKVRGLFLPRVLCTPPIDEDHRSRQIALHRGEQVLAFAARYPVCSQQFRGRSPSSRCPFA